MKLKNTLSLAAALMALAPVALANTTEPRFLEGDMPVYPESARSHGANGTVIVEALVDEQGNVFAADVVQGVHDKIDKVTLAAVQKWTFEPATVDGKATMQVVRIPIHFNLVDPVGESVLRAHDRALASRQ